ncbi:MAG: ABC transporter permease [Candidatus Marinimicrobia bacterium]|mgnify:FL=1|jgi:putative ABC transport system permease protein|nr:ABC transporter permease [Candidatus Neomarinimicrobiota bacterium]MBT3617453.1 ABC transporter permease [Candidatus Neomarinimicrobiota bacterium]MBT3829393.1 ABC transporter permease [Candidatus Neomarinimicrobiota bacterium]MBT3997676.1 ABC transporter permease [Candidatus Neomarinimicrobiota bacterium]MBT4280974.1 ABC transporter permease [Candidatus Neomarinimicrobiota bacterium]
MNETITTIPFSSLVLVFLPVAVVIGLLHTWSLEWKNAIYAILRMLIQLLLIGYFLSYIFESEDASITVGVLSVMVFAASWIALGSIQHKRRAFYQFALLSILVGGGLTLLLVTQFVLQLDPWFMPRYMIPLAGMIFASSMNGVSLAAERLESEMTRDVSYFKARGIALRAALIPITNSLFAVGLVSLPGMMTGQILSGISPLIAVRYQIMVMCMIFSAVGFSTAMFLMLIKPQLSELASEE